MNLLITGTDGFIGKILKEHLSEKHKVFGSVYFATPQTNEIKFDITKEEDFSRLPKIKFDAIIHTAGIVDQNKSKRLIFEVNTLGTERLLEWAGKYSCGHFIQISSISVYGLKVMGQNRSEDNTKRYLGPFVLPYGRSKSLAEERIEKSGLPYTILRLPGVFGENDSYFSSAIIDPLLNEKFFFAGNKDKKYSTLYVKNLGRIIDRLLAKGPQNDSFNCSDHQTSWKTLVGEYAKRLKIPLPKKKRSILNLITHYKDKKFLLPLTFSYFGAHFPNTRLINSLGPFDFLPWQQGVLEACEGYLKNQKKG